MRVTTLAARAAYAIVTVAVAVSVAFVSIRLLPGSALRAQAVEAGVEQLPVPAGDPLADLNEPVHLQFVKFVAGLVRGDLGTSIYNGRPVIELIGERLPSTLTLALASVLVTVALLAAVVAVSSMPRLRSVVNMICVAGSATPTFITGTALIAVLGVPSPASFANVAAATAVLSYFVASSLAVPLIANIDDLEHRSFVTTARAKGLSQRRVFWVHVMPNAVRPLWGLMAVQIGFLLSGTVVTEALFTRGGVGRLMLDSVMRRDYPVVQGIVLYAAVVYVVGQALARSVSNGENPVHGDA